MATNGTHSVSPTLSASVGDTEPSTEEPLLGKDVQATKKHWSKTSLFLLALNVIIIVIGVLIVAYEKTKPESVDGGSSSIKADKAIVAADDARCSKIGVSMLRKGGHAVDAAVAAVLCAGVVNPSESGIGGGGFMMVRTSSSAQTQAFDMRETAPSASSQDMFEHNPGAKSLGPLSIAVPGELAGLHKAWTKYGRLKWKTLFQPAIKLAKHGFIVAPYLGRVISHHPEKIRGDPGLREVFAPNGKLLQAGDICFNLKLAHTLEAVAKRGPQALYEGVIGEKLVKDVKDAGGILTVEDLRNFKVDVPDVVTVNAMGYTILGMPPPSTGTVGLSLILSIFDSYGDVNAAKGFLGLHRLIEALKHMFSARMHLGDPKFVHSNTLPEMLNGSYAEQIREKIFDDTTFPPEHYMYRWSQLRDRGTSELCVVDEDRNAVSLTTTVNDYFGSGFRSLSTGIILNNEMDDFSTPTEISDDSLPPAPHNFIKPNKRPLSSMTPIIILKDGQLAGVTGASGGLYIIPAVVQVFLNHFIFRMTPLAAVLSPRIYHQLIPNIVLYENLTLIDHDRIELPEDTKIYLQERGHLMQATNKDAICQLIVHNLEHNGVNVMGWKQGKDSNKVFHGTLTAVSDPRKDGKPAGL